MFPQFFDLFDDPHNPDVIAAVYGPEYAHEFDPHDLSDGETELETVGGAPNLRLVSYVDDPFTGDLELDLDLDPELLNNVYSSSEPPRRLPLDLSSVLDERERHLRFPAGSLSGPVRLIVDNTNTLTDVEKKEDGHPDSMERDDEEMDKQPFKNVIRMRPPGSILRRLRDS